MRSQNEDVGVTFGIGDFDVLIVADGCGGIPHGREAAYLAAASAGIRLIQMLGTPPRWGFPDVEDAIRSAIWSAHHQLALQADDFGIACGDINGDHSVDIGDAMIIVGEIGLLMEFNADR